MRIWYHSQLGGQRLAADVSADCISIGRGPHNDIVLDSYCVAQEAALLRRINGKWRLDSLGRNGCRLGGRTVRPGECVEFEADVPIEVFPFTLSLEADPGTALDAVGQRALLDQRMSDFIRDLHVDLLSLMDLETEDSERRNKTEYQLTLEHTIEELASSRHLGEPQNTDLTAHVAGHSVRQALIEQLIHRSGRQGTEPDHVEGGWRRLVSAISERERDLAALVGQAAETLGINAVADLSEQMDLVDASYWTIWDALAAESLEDVLLYLALREFKKQIKDIVFGYGPLEDLLRIPTITEIMVVDSNHIFVEKKGIVENSGRRFISDDVTLAVIDRIVSKVGRRIDKSQPLVDARLTDGSRVNAVIPPLAVSGPCITIRKFPAERLRMDDLVEMGALTATTAQFLQAAVLARRNILIAGGTGTGKTTLLNCLTDFIPAKERIVTVEDTAELQIDKEHVVRMETKQANAEGAGAYTIHDLVRNALRMRPDRVIVGECRGGEALDMLQAMNTGHDGSLTTIHANTPQDVQLRLEVMVRTAADLPVDSIHRQIAAAVDLIVQLTRCRDGRRRVTQVTEVVDVDDLEGGVRMKDLFHLEQVDGESQLVPTGCLPSFIEKLISAGYDLENFYR